MQTSIDNVERNFLLNYLVCVNEYRVNVEDYGTQYGVESEKFVSLW